MIVKVCGIMNLDDARRALDEGANALGFNFYAKSPRCVTADQAGTILEELEGTTALFVGVFVRGYSFMDARMAFGSADVHPKVTVVQLHGFKSPAELPDLGKRVFVAVSAGQIGLFPDHEIIIDSSWGTGRVDDWEALRNLGRPYILSGGLTPSNVGVAIETLHPAGVDVCSGVESSPGRKDPEKLRQFMKEVRRVYGEF